MTQKEQIFDNVVFFTVSDLDGIITDISSAYLKFTGFHRKDVIGKNHSIFRNHHLDTKIIKNLWETLHKNEVWEGELLNSKASGEEYWVQVTISPLFDEYNQKTGYLAIQKDITHTKKLEELSHKNPLTLLGNRTAFENLFKRKISQTHWKKEHFDLILIDVDFYSAYKLTFGRMAAERALCELSDSIHTLVTSKGHELFHISESEFAIILINQSDEYISALCEVLAKKVEALQLNHPKNPYSRHFSISLGAVNLDISNKFLYCNDIFNLADINLKQAKVQEHQRYILKVNQKDIQAISDASLITKLQTREALVHDIGSLQSKAMLIILHMRQIATIKHLYGFDFIREIILQKAQKLQEIIKDEHVYLYNLNIKEFAILITDSALFEKYFLLLKHYILTNEDFYPNNLDEPVIVDFTAGIAYGIANLFNHADITLQEALLANQKYKIYHDRITSKEDEKERIRWHSIYKTALHEGRIIPYFQPIVSTTTQEVVKYEALARIEMEDGEIITPYHFLDAAKEDKSFEYFTRQMMQKVFQIYEKNDIAISMNLSYENIISESMLDYIKNRLDKYGGKGITFEILESEEVLDYQYLTSFIDVVKSYGCEISVDDFGSGYSNFSHILQLDIDYLKLDGSIIQKLTTDTNVYNMVDGLIEYAKKAKIKAIAEFVSTKELLEAVKELGVQYSQGYYFSEPKSPQELGFII